MLSMYRSIPRPTAEPHQPLRTCRRISRRAGDIWSRCSRVISACKPRRLSRLSPRGSSGIITCIEISWSICRSFCSIRLKISLISKGGYPRSRSIPYTWSCNLGSIIPRSSTRCSSGIITSGRCTTAFSVSAPCRSAIA
jgi:hypothetical protein